MFYAAVATAMDVAAAAVVAAAAGIGDEDDARRRRYMWLLLMLAAVHEEEQEGLIEAWRGARPLTDYCSFKHDHFQWRLEDDPPENTVKLTRFTPAQLRRLAPLLLGDTTLRFRTSMATRSAYKVEPLQALYLVCERLAYPARYYDIRMGRGHAWMSHVFNGTIERLYESFKALIHWWPSLNNVATLQRYGRAAQRSGHGDGLLWGFIDGTFFQYARPSDADKQSASYSGYHRANGEKLQCITTPDGLIVHASEPYLGPANDWQMFFDSGVEDKLRDIFAGRDEELYLYGDSAYRDCFGVIEPFRPVAGGWRYLTDEQRRANYFHSSARISVEMAFGDNWKHWTYVNGGKMLRSGCQPTAAYRLVSVLLQNCLTCLRAEEGRLNTVGSVFQCQPPTLEQYLGLEPLVLDDRV